MKSRAGHEQPTFQVRLREWIDASQQRWENIGRTLLAPAWRSIRHILGLNPTHHAYVVHDSKIADNRAMFSPALIVIPIKILNQAGGNNTRIPL